MGAPGRGLLLRAERWGVGGQVAEETGGLEPSREDPNPAGFSLVKVVSATMLILPDCQSLVEDQAPSWGSLLP